MPLLPQVSFFLFIIFTVYAMLPLGMRDAAAAGLASSLSHLLVLGLYLGPQPDSRPALLPQVRTRVVPAAPGLRGRPGPALLAAIVSSEHAPSARRAAAPWQGAMLRTGHKPIPQDGALRELVHHCSRRLQTPEDASGPRGRDLTRGPELWGQMWMMEPSQRM